MRAGQRPRNKPTPHPAAPAPLLADASSYVSCGGEVEESGGPILAGQRVRLRVSMPQVPLQQGALVQAWTTEKGPATAATGLDAVQQARSARGLGTCSHRPARPSSVGRRSMEEDSPSTCRVSGGNHLRLGTTKGKPQTARQLPMNPASARRGRTRQASKGRATQGLLVPLLALPAICPQHGTCRLFSLIGGFGPEWLRAHTRICLFTRGGREGGAA